MTNQLTLFLACCLVVLTGCEGTTRGDTAFLLQEGGTSFMSTEEPFHPDIAGTWSFVTSACQDAQGGLVTLHPHSLFIAQASNGNLTIENQLTGETHLTSFQGKAGFRLVAEFVQCNEITSCVALGDTLECTHDRTCDIVAGNIFCQDVVYQFSDPTS